MANLYTGYKYVIRAVAMFSISRIRMAESTNTDEGCLKWKHLF